MQRIFIKDAIANHKFPNEYSDVISFKSINIWKCYWKNTKGS